MKEFQYLAVGNSFTKKEAERNAARDFVSFLVREGILRSQDIPTETVPMAMNKSNNKTPDGFGIDGNCPAAGNDSKLLDLGQTCNVQDVKFELKDSELVDVNAAVHGNWTVENAKGKLHQYLQMNKIITRYKYTPIGPDHARYVQIELMVYITCNYDISHCLHIHMYTLSCSNRPGSLALLR